MNTTTSTRIGAACGIGFPLALIAGRNSSGTFMLGLFGLGAVRPISRLRLQPASQLRSRRHVVGLGRVRGRIDGHDTQGRQRCTRDRI